MGFFPEHFKMLIEEGNEIELACNCDEPVPQFCVDLGLEVHHIPFSRSPFNKSNFKAIHEFKKLLLQGNYDLVHTHTPNASAIVRLVCRNMRKQGLQVFYTAHGFHFYKGAPLKNWLLYYPVEWLCSFWTDCLITINDEDYMIAKHKMHALKTKQVPGVGLDFSRFAECAAERSQIREEFGISAADRVLIYVGELNENKNQTSLLDMMSVLCKRRNDVRLMLVGEGPCKQSLMEKAKALGISNRVIFTGFRRDIPKLLKASDLCVPSSIREGLGLNVLEAMICRIPVVAYDNRGHRSIIQNTHNGYLVPHGDYKAMSEKVLYLLEHQDVYNQIADTAMKSLEKYSIPKVLERMKQIYEF